PSAEAGREASLGVCGRRRFHRDLRGTNGLNEVTVRPLVVDVGNSDGHRGLRGSRNVRGVVVGDEHRCGDEREDRKQEENDFSECNRRRCRALACDFAPVQPFRVGGVMTSNHGSTVRRERCGLSYPREGGVTSVIPPRATITRSTSSGGNSPCSTTPGCWSSLRASSPG